LNYQVEWKLWKGQAVSEQEKREFEEAFPVKI
jgi:hypothetical protein